MLGVEIIQRRVEIQFHRGFRMSRCGLSLGHAFKAAARQPHVFADHVVITHIARQTATAVGLKVENLTGFLDHPVKQPFLIVAPQMRTTGCSIFWIRHCLLPC